MNINKKFRVGDVVALEFGGYNELIDNGPVNFDDSCIPMGLGDNIEVERTFMEHEGDFYVQRFVPAGETYYRPNSYRYKLITPAKEFNKKDWM